MVPTLRRRYGLTLAGTAVRAVFHVQEGRLLKVARQGARLVLDLESFQYL